MWETAAASEIQKEASLPDLRSVSCTASTPEIRVFNQRELSGKESLLTRARDWVSGKPRRTQQKYPRSK